MLCENYKLQVTEYSIFFPFWERNTKNFRTDVNISCEFSLLLYVLTLCHDCIHICFGWGVIVGKVHVYVGRINQMFLVYEDQANRVDSMGLYVLEAKEYTYKLNE